MLYLFRYLKRLAGRDRDTPMKYFLGVGDPGTSSSDPSVGIHSSLGMSKRHLGADPIIRRPFTGISILPASIIPSSSPRLRPSRAAASPSVRSPIDSSRRGSAVGLLSRTYFAPFLIGGKSNRSRSPGSRPSAAAAVSRFSGHRVRHADICIKRARRAARIFCPDAEVLCARRRTCTVPDVRVASGVGLEEVPVGVTLPQGPELI